jgi:hypothetical protein
MGIIAQEENMADLIAIGYPDTTIALQAEKQLQDALHTVELAVIR